MKKLSDAELEILKPGGGRKTGSGFLRDMIARNARACGKCGAPEQEREVELLSIHHGRRAAQYRVEPVESR